MNEPAIPKFEWGQRVRATTDLFNDGSFPDEPADVLLAKTGDLGEIVQVGRHVEANVAVYLVEFGERRIVGCLEEEIELSYGPQSADHAQKDANA
ncbi:MAG: nitrogen fixation protein NifZ [Hyphomicrobium sp.]|uniref:nitrogen fixation protein NifZ n=1 Tax=Hyphomicrobium sp. TaxID=82 RepID=UPI001325486C|nr:nitrogen fixation protein NifZ [Hyphomicrobium sp.]KAB2944009.1 MAG: nitrogen fixation protein NifZ [Hyphomicrobium sp.]MBZ0209301.1 nitrogen fixation protein NifZ [Hyphomicrobium sp.]